MMYVCGKVCVCVCVCVCVMISHSLTRRSVAKKVLGIRVTRKRGGADDDDANDDDGDGAGDGKACDGDSSDGRIAEQSEPQPLSAKDRHKLRQQSRELGEKKEQKFCLMYAGV